MQTAHRTRRLLSGDSRVDGRCDHAVHMIVVAQQTVLSRFRAGVTRLAEVFFYFTEVGHEGERVAFLVTLEVRASLFEVVARQTTAIIHNAEMGLVDEMCELALFGVDRRR